MVKSLFEQLGCTYHEENGYLIPDLRLPDEEEQNIGLFGHRHLRYPKEYRRGTYINLLTSGRLNIYLAEIDKQAQSITAQLKAENALEWVQKLNNIRACAREIVEKALPLFFG